VGRRRLVLKAFMAAALKRVHPENNFRKCIYQIMWCGLRPQALRSYAV